MAILLILIQVVAMHCSALINIGKYHFFSTMLAMVGPTEKIDIPIATCMCDQTCKNMHNYSSHIATCNFSTLRTHKIYR